MRQGVGGSKILETGPTRAAAGLHARIRKIRGWGYRRQKLNFTGFFVSKEVKNKEEKEGTIFGHTEDTNRKNKPS